MKNLIFKLKIHISTVWKEECSSLIWAERESLSFCPFGVPRPLTIFPLEASVFSAQALSPHSELPPVHSSAGTFSKLLPFPSLEYSTANICESSNCFTQMYLFWKANISGMVFADENTTPSDIKQGLRGTKQRAISNLLAVLLSQISSDVGISWEKHNNSASEDVFITFYTV